METSLLIRWAVVLLLLGRFSTCGAGDGREREKIDGAPIALRVMYAGDLHTPRAKDFIEFLEQHFATIGKMSVEEFTGEDAEGFDAVILDYGEVRVVNNSIDVPELRVGDDYHRPTLILGATGALISSRLNLKTGYL